MKGLAHLKSTLLGIALLISATLYKFSPYIFEFNYNPDMWITSGLYLAAVVLIIFDPEEAEKAVNKIIDKLTR